MFDSFAAIQDALVQLGVSREEITPAASLRDDLSIDSTEQIELIIALEQQIGTELDEKQVKSVRTVAELVSVVDACRGQITR